ncbi:nucleolar pre-ribosomal-associated protein 1-like [Oenanthe melanoleuca]|uniref:nucleolar pre-ribosomal-associated protein 1-like n=1 Tax=Oenanthe melanoleuca TaxID=2939378 RepID=UPI0024C16D0F|nr:nucleolar pre-ribosomal-associated protein 1-like [Oenanthe melanoleuca]
MDEESLMREESSNDKTLEDTLTLIFRHPALESWFLELELRSIPQPGLNPVTVKLLSAHLNSGELQLLKTGAPVLQSITRDHRHILSKYFKAITKSVLEELLTVGKDRSQVYPRNSHQLQALEELHMYITAAQLKEIILTMLQLLEMGLTSQKSEKSPKIGKQLSFYGQILVQLFTDSPCVWCRGAGSLSCPVLTHLPDHCGHADPALQDSPAAVGALESEQCHWEVPEETHGELSSTGSCAFAVQRPVWFQPTFRR